MTIRSKEIDKMTEEEAKATLKAICLELKLFKIPYSHGQEPSSSDGIRWYNHGYNLVESVVKILPKSVFNNLRTIGSKVR